MWRMIRALAALAGIVAALAHPTPAAAQVTITDLGTLSGGSERESYAYAIHNQGQVVGRSALWAMSHAVLWTMTP